jgi:hypothetical protein
LHRFGRFRNLEQAFRRAGRSDVGRAERPEFGLGAVGQALGGAVGGQIVPRAIAFKLLTFALIK